MEAVTTNRRVPVPRDRENDYTREAAARRAELVRERTGAWLEHATSYSFDPAILSGNVELFVGVAQVRSASPAPCSSTASTPRASSTCRWPRPRARWSRATTAGCGCCTRPVASPGERFLSQYQTIPARLV